MASLKLLFGQQDAFLVMRKCVHLRTCSQLEEEVFCHARPELYTIEY
jgi:hypothetical protein